jgi:hypothetical protein
MSLSVVAASSPLCADERGGSIRRRALVVLIAWCPVKYPHHIPHARRRITMVPRRVIHGPLVHLEENLRITLA